MARLKIGGWLEGLGVLRFLGNLSRVFDKVFDYFFLVFHYNEYNYSHKLTGQWIV